MTQRQDVLGGLGELIDETEKAVLYTSGNYRYAYFPPPHVTFPDQRSLRLPVRGNSRDNAIMTAVDQASSQVARYALVPPGWDLRPRTFREHAWVASPVPVEITVHPSRRLTDELALALTLPAPWLSARFAYPPSGH